MAGSTWTWLGITNSLNSASNWSLTAGAGNASGHPIGGDTAIFTGSGQVPQFLDTALTGGATLDLTGTASVQFLNDGSIGSSTSIDATSVIDATGTAATVLVGGPFTNAGTIALTGTGAHLAITVAANGILAGAFANDGTISVNPGDTLAITTTGSASFADPGGLFVAGGSALVQANLTELDNFAISAGGSLELNQSGSAALPDVAFSGAGSLKLDNAANFAGNISGFVAGDTLDLGAVTIASVVFDGSGDITAIGSGGGTLFTAQTDNGPLGGDGRAGTFALSGTGGLAGGLQVTQGNGGDAVITVLGPSTWLWKNGASAKAETAADWTLVSGPGNGFGSPGSGDTAINAGGTILGGGQFQLTGNTIELGGTAGLAALVVGGGGGTAASLSNPSLDGTTVIGSAVPGNATAETSLLSEAGTFVNQGTIEADGPAGSSFTIAVAATTVNGTLEPGYFINDQMIEVAAGNSMTIAVAGTAEFFNASLILVNGGSLLFDAAAGAVIGGYAPGSGVIVIEGDGTVETNAAYPATVNGNIPVYAFDNTTAGATLKIDTIGSFGGNILGFGQGDTIDIGTSIAVGKLVYSSVTGILNLENAGGTILDSLLFASGNFKASSFTVGTGSDGNTILTTTVQNDTDVGTSGTWQNAGLWSNGVPGTLDTAIIGGLGAGSVTVTTGATAVSVGALVLTGENSLLQITSATTADAYAMRQYAGTLEVTSGNTLTAPQWVEVGGSGQIDPGALLDLTGHQSYGATGANAGTIGAQNTGTQALQVESTFLVNGGTLNAGPSQSGGNGGRIYIGYEGASQATLTVQNSGTNAGVVTDTYAILSSDPTSSGVLILNGNATWTDQIDPHDTATTRGYMVVGYNNQATVVGTVTPPPFSAAATLVVENGATLTEQSYAQIANTVDSAGSVLVSNALWTIGTGADGGFLNVGQVGAGTLTVAQGGSVQLAAGGTFVNNGTSFTGNGINVGGSAGASGTLTVDGGLLTDAAGINDGQAGQGLVQIENGGTIQLTGSNGITVGSSAGSAGSLMVGGAGTGLLSYATTAKGLSVGAAGRGTVDVGSGGTIQLNGIGGIGIGTLASGSGLVLVSGPNALVSEGTAANGIGVGLAGAGTLDVESGGTIQLNGTGGIGIGVSAGASGLLIVNGPDALLNEGGLSNGIGVATAGNGTLEVENGGTVSLNTTGNFDGIGVAQTSGASGLILVSGAGALLSVNDPNGGMGVGQGGQGTLTVQSGGSVSISGYGLGIGNVSGSGGTVTVSGTGSAITTLGTNGQVTVGSPGSGLLSISAGGRVSASAAVFVGNGAVTVNGGTLSAAGATIGGSGAGTMTVSGGGLVTNTGAASFDVGGSAAGGTLVINGGTVSNSSGGFFGVGNTNASGTLTVEGGGSLITGGSGGFADINATGAGYSAVATVSGATWTSNGQLIVGDTGHGTLDINSRGVVNAGTSTVTIGQSAGGSGSVSLESGGMLMAGAIVLDNVYNLAASGNLSVAGGTVTTGSLTDWAGGTISVSSGSITVNGNAMIGDSSLSELIFESGTQTPVAPAAGASLNLTGGRVTTNGLTVDSGNVTLSGGTLDSLGLLSVGSQGNGQVTVNAGGSLIAANGLQIDLALPGGTVVAPPSGNGTLVVNGGSVSDTGAVSIGNGGTAIVTIEAGGTFTATGTNTGINQVSIGSAIGGSASVTVNDGLLNLLDETLFIGNGGNGSLLVEGGGTVTSTYAGAGPEVDINATGIAQASAFVTGTNTVWDTSTGNGQFVVGDTGSGSLTVSAGALLDIGDAGLAIGNQSGGSGSVTVSNGGSLLVTPSLVGLPALYIGSAAQAAGALTVTGPGSAVIADGAVAVGYAGSGSLVIANQATVSSGFGLSGLTPSFDIASGSGTSGSAAVTGTGALLHNTGLFVVGDGGLGNLAITGGGTVVTADAIPVSAAGVVGVASAPAAIIANSAGGAGSSVNVTGAGSTWQITGTLDVGNAGFGQLSISQGATVAAAGLDAGVTAQGAIDLSGAGSTLKLTGDATIADAGSAEMSILNGATVSGTDLTVGSQGTSSGILTVSDAGSLLTLSGTLYIGTADGVGDLTVGPGATIIATSVQQQGQVVLEGGLLDPNVVNVTAGQIIGGFGATGGTGDLIDNDGTLLAKAGTKASQKVMTFLGTIVGQGIMQIDAGSTLELTGPVLSGSPVVDVNNDGTPVAVPSTQTVIFETGTAGALQLDAIGGFAGTIGAYYAGDLFVISGGVLSGLAVSNGDTLTVNDGGGIDSIAFAAPLSAGQFAIVGGNTIEVVQCFAEGTRLQTARGPVAVEALREGDRLVTAEDARQEPVVWIGRRTVNCTAHPKPKQVWPVRVRRGALGPRRPVRDLWLSPDHAVFVNDVLVPVKHLINGSSIAQVRRGRITYYHVELPHHELILAEGLAVESYLDVGDRSNFENGGGAVALFPNFTSLKWETEGCAPLVVTGAELAAARAVVAAVGAKKRKAAA